jgi:4'-phosphopantetheinyl transferase
MSHAALDDWPLPDRPVTGCASGELHLWRVPLEAETALQQRGLAMLSEDERMKASRFLRDRDRHHFVNCRAAVRQILGQYQGVAPSQVAFGYQARGKPFLLRRGWPPLEFNVANSHELALIAVTVAEPVGVDLEKIRPLSDLLGLTHHYFADEEVALLSTLGGQQRETAFFRAWTRKEAVLKAVGSGLSFPLRDVVVTLGEDQPCQVVSFGAGEPAPSWWLLHLDPSPGYLGAVAARQPFTVIRRWSWDSRK